VGPTIRTPDVNRLETGFETGTRRDRRGDPHREAIALDSQLLVRRDTLGEFRRQSFLFRKVFYWPLMIVGIVNIQGLRPDGQGRNGWRSDPVYDNIQPCARRRSCRVSVPVSVHVSRIILVGSGRVVASHLAHGGSQNVVTKVLGFLRVKRIVVLTLPDQIENTKGRQKDGILIVATSPLVLWWWWLLFGWYEE
jgi:hypothetical protein